MSKALRSKWLQTQLRYSKERINQLSKMAHPERTDIARHREDVAMVEELIVLNDQSEDEASPETTTSGDAEVERITGEKPKRKYVRRNVEPTEAA